MKLCQIFDTNQVLPWHVGGSLCTLKGQNQSLQQPEYKKTQKRYTGNRYGHVIDLGVLDNYVGLNETDPTTVNLGFLV